jgi:hypothetical protein
MFSEQSSKFGASLAALLLMCSCTYPGVKEIGDFSDSAAAVSQLAKSAAVLDVELDAKTKAGKTAVQFARGKNGNYQNDFPPEKGRLLSGKSDKDWAARVAVLNAMIAYATTVRSVSDASQGNQVRDSLSGLSLALSNFASASAAEIANSAQRAAAQRDAQRIAAAGDIIAIAAGAAVNAYAAHEIRQVMKQVHPAIVEIVDILKKDFVLLAGSISNKTGNYEDVIRDKLEVHWDDPNLTSAQKYDLYMAATNEMGVLRERLEVVNGLPTVLDDLVKAHADLKDNVESKQSLLAFLTLVQELAAKIKKLQDIERASNA